MSLSNELKAAKARMDAQIKEEAQRQKKKKTTRRGATEWKYEDEIVALYLYLASASKFIKENYSKKRKISVRAMSLRMSVFESIDRGKVKGEVNPQTQEVYNRYARIPVDELLKVVISIHRSEFVRD